MQVTANGGADQLSSWPLPFGEPLLAVTPKPGTSPGDPNAQALAVGVGGEVSWDKPGQGGTPVYL